MHQGRFRVFCLMLADAFTLAFSWFVIANGHRILVEAQYYHVSSCLRAWPVILIFIGANWVAHLYQGRGVYPCMPVSQVEEFRRLVLNVFVTHLAAMGISVFLSCGEHPISLLVVIFSALITAVLAQPVRDLVRLALKWLNVGQMPAFVIGEGHVSNVVKKWFGSNSYYGFNIVRHFGRTDLEALMDEAKRYDIKHIFCCFKDDRYFKCLLPKLASRFSYIEYLPTMASFPIAAAHPLTIGPLGGLEMVNQRRFKLLMIEKFVIDRALSLVIMILTFPLFILAPILIKLTSRGPVFYRARRLGKRGQTIQVLKFRSMYEDSDKRLCDLLQAEPALKVEFEKNYKLKNDPRVTPFGRFLRKTSIDELPQLINVLRGEMALVGPRPIVEGERHYYGGSYEIFSSMKPGITGLWQTSGRSDCSYDERVEMDTYYALNWSIWLDLWIVCRTVAAVLKMKGSY